MIHDMECGLPCQKCKTGECLYLDMACRGDHWCGCDPWFVYLLECSDGSYYCGIAKNLNNRIDAHNNKKGAKYTKSRLPVKLLKFWRVDSKSTALKIEYRIKQLPKAEKLNFRGI